MRATGSRKQRNGQNAKFIIATEKEGQREAIKLEKCGYGKVI